MARLRRPSVGFGQDPEEATLTSHEMIVALDRFLTLRFLVEGLGHATEPV